MASVVASRPAGGAPPASATPAPAKRAPSDAMFNTSLFFSKEFFYGRAHAHFLEQNVSGKGAPPGLVADTPADTQHTRPHELGVSWGSSFGQSVAALIDGESA